MEEAEDNGSDLEAVTLEAGGISGAEAGTGGKRGRLVMRLIHDVVIEWLPGLSAPQRRGGPRKCLTIHAVNRSDQNSLKQTNTRSHTDLFEQNNAKQQPTAQTHAACKHTA